MFSFFNFITWELNPEIFKIGSFGLRYYAFCFLCAFIFSYIILLKIFKKEGRPQELLDQLSIYIFLGTLIGARLGHCLFYDWGYFKNHLLEIFIPFSRVNGSYEFTGFLGLASHGGAIGILLALYLFCRKTKTDFLWIADRLMVVVPLACAFIRVGNFFNSEMIGFPTDVPWAIIFAEIDMIPRHPAQLYEAIAYFLVFIVMYQLYWKGYAQKPGFLLGIFLILSFTARFVIEFYKLDQVGFESNMQFNMGQLLSIPFVLIGLYLVFRKENNKNISKEIGTR
ncbi:prolipoprotein diacylglyceryl transferase [Sphingobacterium hungaricum]